MINIFKIKKYHINDNNICSKKYNDRKHNFKTISEEELEKLNNNREICIKCYKKFHGKTRNHKECNKCETTIYKMISENVSLCIKGFNFKNINVMNKEGKNDVMFKAFYKGKIVKVGIQVKRYNYGNVENWINPYKLLEFIKNDDFSKKEFYSIFKKIKLDIYLNYYLKYIKKHKNSRFLKLAMCISKNGVKDNLIPVNSFKLKKKFIKGENNQVDFFFYCIINKNNTITWDLVDDNFIKNKKLFWHPRSIYSSSGDTQLKQPAFFLKENYIIQNYINNY